jgi:hypothetical protein
MAQMSGEWEGIWQERRSCGRDGRKESLGLEQVLLLDKSGLKRLPSDQSPNPVIGRVAQDRCGAKDSEDQPDIQISRPRMPAANRSESPGGTASPRGRFHRRRSEQDQIGAGSIVLNHLAQVFVEVQEQIYEVF